jgi:ribosomal protein S18 acetylase RimI-like enzyme
MAAVCTRLGFLCGPPQPETRTGSKVCLVRLVSMVETVHGSSQDEGIRAAARLLHDFNLEYEEPAPPPDVLAPRLSGLVADGQITVLLARAHENGTPVGVAVMRVQPSILSLAHEAYLAELYVEPSRRGQGYGRELMTEALRVAREHGAEYAFLITSEDDRPAQRLYEAAGFRRTEGEGGPLMLAYERDL